MEAPRSKERPSPSPDYSGVEICWIREVSFVKIDNVSEPDTGTISRDRK
jgi:hypothetical protein